MEAVLIVVVAAGLSAGVVWWAMSPPEARDRRSSARTVRTARPAAAPQQEADGFVLLPDAEPVLDDERPPAAWSLIRLVVAIAIVAAVAVAAIGLIGLFVKAQLDEYFTTGSQTSGVTSRISRTIDS